MSDQLDMLRTTRKCKECGGAHQSEASGDLCPRCYKGQEEEPVEPESPVPKSRHRGDTYKFRDWGKR